MEKCYAVQVLNFETISDLVKEACKTCPQALGYASDRLRNDFDLVSQVVQSSSTFSVLSFASQDLKNNKEIVLTAIRRNPFAYLEASDALQKDEQVAMEAISQRGVLLYHAPMSIQDNLEIVLRAVENDPWGYEFVKSDSIKNHQQVLNLVGKLIEELKLYSPEEVYQIRHGGIFFESLNEREITMI